MMFEQQPVYYLQCICGYIMYDLLRYCIFAKLVKFTYCFNSLSLLYLKNYKLHRKLKIT